MGIPLITDTTPPTNIINMVCRLPPLRRGIYGYSRLDAGNLFQRGRARALRQGFYINQLKNREINLILQLLVFSMIRSPAVENGCRNGIHHQRRAPKQYE
jgi:hypothetical protein